ncbi:MAG: hypothetical protein DRN15_07400 [Thermoprotei archaeon]|nr:MAG: hypothetical protein DRM97_05905 [Thermoprotei archaeon]RLF23044.1 MAG: hypothetical protein DRN15_07400 [Thermoprotei archaeon]
MKEDEIVEKVLRSGIRRDILKLLKTRPYSLSELTQALGMETQKKPLIYYHLKTMMTYDLVSVIEKDNVKYYVLTEKGRKLAKIAEKRPFITFMRYSSRIIMPVVGVVSLLMLLIGMNTGDIYISQGFVIIGFRSLLGMAFAIFLSTFIILVGLFILEKTLIGRIR